MIKYAHTTHILQHLDFLVIANNAIAHLACTLALPVWVFLPFVPGWRCILGCTDSRWYPNLHLVRKPAPGD